MRFHLLVNVVNFTVNGINVNFRELLLLLSRGGSRIFSRGGGADFQKFCRPFFSGRPIDRIDFPRSPKTLRKAPKSAPVIKTKKSMKTNTLCVKILTVDCKKLRHTSYFSKI